MLRRELCLSFRRPEQLFQPLVFFDRNHVVSMGLCPQLFPAARHSAGCAGGGAAIVALGAGFFCSRATPMTHFEQLALSGQSFTLRWQRPAPTGC